MITRRVIRCVATSAALVLMTTNRCSHATACSCSASTWATTPATPHSAHHRLTQPAAAASGECTAVQHPRLAGCVPQRRQPSRSKPRKGSLWLTATPALGVRGGAASMRQVSGGREPAAYSTGLRRSAKICTLFMLSYVCSIGFNVNNKRALLLVPLPWTYAAMNLLVGSGIALASWSLKTAPWPRITLQDTGMLMCMGILHAVSHLTVVLGLGAGAVSFLQTVKAAEACFTAVLSFFLLGQRLPIPVYLTLLPVVVGVGITSCNQIRFSWVALMSALVSNLTNALRNVLIVRYMAPSAGATGRGAKAGFLSPRRGHDTDQGATSMSITSNPLTRTFQSEAALTSTRAGGAARSLKAGGGLANLAPGDTYRLLTLFGAALLLPAAACFERNSWPALWQGATDAARAIFSGRGGGLPLQQASMAATGVGDASVGAAAVSLAESAAAGIGSAARGDMAAAFRHTLLAGVCFNLFYYLTFMLLGQLHPVTHAVGNTVKRIVVIAAGAAAFGGDLGGARGAMGSALAVAGVLGYSIAKARCKPGAGTVGVAQKSR